MTNPQQPLPAVEVSEPTTVSIPIVPVPEALRVQESRSPTTTAEQDLNTAGQRHVNLKWENTQAFIAITVTIANMVAALYIVFTSKEPTTVALAIGLLSNSLFLVTGFYFSRTNHTAIGGIGPKSTDNQTHLGR